MESFETEVFVSAASAWEICTKHRLGRLPEAENLVGNLSSILGQLGFRELPVSLKHAERAGTLPGEHRDPFDRMLIAQAQTENLSVVSSDRFFDKYAVTRIW
jgi:PIN domain nuclease of toxin-antitoxin system